jgi:hypothetical protein
MANKLDFSNYANIFNLYKDLDGTLFFNFMNSITIDGDIDPQLYDIDYAHSFTSFYTLSKKYYDTPNLWWTILVANNIQNPFSVKGGQQVKILKPIAINELLNQINNS